MGQAGTDPDKLASRQGFGVGSEKGNPLETSLVLDTGCGLKHNFILFGETIILKLIPSFSQRNSEAETKGSEN
jgi:hypothetical protein